MRALTVLVVVAGATFAAAGALSAAALRDVAARRAELSAGQRVVETRFGPVAYADWGEGPPALVIHGAGGGHDQGRLIAEALGPEGYRWIAPSRFGYPGSALFRDPSTAAQADAFAELLDTLGVESAIVLAFSGGTPPALQLAERHPDRVAALVLLSSAPFTPYEPDRTARPIPDWLYGALFGNDVVYWALSKTIPGALEAAFDVRPELRKGLPADEAGFAASVVRSFLPASDRVSGVRNEGAAIDPAAVYDLDAIAAPTLVVHARDDGINPYAVGEAEAARIRGAELVGLESGGHLLLGGHAEVRHAIRAFLARRGNGAAARRP